MEYEIFTLSSDNDYRFVNLICLLESNLAYDKAKVNVIPFNDENHITDYISKIYEDVEVVEVDPMFDKIGISIFGDKEYRRNVPCWRLFRKLNFLPKNDFNGTYHLFLDSNSVIVNSLRSIDIPKCHEDTMLFGARSVSGRTLTQSGEALCSILNPNVKDGFNAGFMLTSTPLRNDFFSRDYDFSSFKNAINIAPEQGFLALYLSIENLKCSTLSEVNKYCKPILGSSYSGGDNNGIILGEENFKDKKNKSFIIKWSGLVNLDPSKAENKNILELLLTRGIKRFMDHDKRDEELNKHILNGVEKFLNKKIEA